MAALMAQLHVGLFQVRPNNPCLPQLCARASEQETLTLTMRQIHQSTAASYRSANSYVGSPAQFRRQPSQNHLRPPLA